MSDEYVEQATKITGSDAPDEMRLDGTESKQQMYQRFSVWNSLDWNGKWRDEERATQKDASAIIDAIASSLELTDLQATRAKSYFDSLPDSYNQAYSTALLAVCVCGLSGRQDGREYHPNTIHPSTDESTGSFAHLAREEIGVSYSQLYSCWNRVRGEVL